MKKKTFHMLIREALKNIKKGTTFLPKDHKKHTMVEKGIPEYGGDYFKPTQRLSETLKLVK